MFFNFLRLVFLMFSAPVFAEGSLSIQKAINLAVDYNIELKQAAMERDAANARTDQAYAAYWPKIDLIAKTDNKRIAQDADYVASLDQQSQISAALLYTLYDFGARSAEVDAARYSLEGTEVKESLQKEALFFDTFKAFIQYDFANLNYELSRQYLNDVNQLHMLIKERVNAGFSPKSDKVRGELTVSEASSLVETARKGVTDSLIVLSNITGVNPKEIDSILYAPFRIEKDVESITINSNVNNPSIKVMLTNVKMYESKTASLQAERYPKIQLVGTYRHDFNREYFPGSEAYIQLVVPLTDGGLLRSQVRESVNNYGIAKLMLEKTYRDLDKRQRDFINIYNSTYDKLIIDIASAEQAKKTLDIYQSEFSLGSRPLIDLINTQKDLLNANVNILNDKMNLYLAMVALYNLNGDTMSGLNKLARK
nr:TolC family protein [Enterobacter asburiae]